MKNKLKKLSKYIFALILISSFGVIVYSANGAFGDGGNNGTHGAGQTSPGSPTRWHDERSSGFRVSFVKANGQFLGYGIDYIRDPYFSENASNLVYSANYKCNKVNYMRNECFAKTPADNVTKLSGLKFSAKSLNVLQEIFNKNGFSRINLDSLLISNTSSRNVFSPLEKGTKNQITSFFNELISQGGLGNDIDAYLVPGTKDVYDLFVIFEPLVSVKLNGYEYFGTEYEMANIAKNIKPGTLQFTNKPNGCLANSKNPHPGGGLCDLASVLTRYGACALYLDGSLYEDIQKYGEGIKHNFTSNSYFSSFISIPSDISRICTSSGSKGNDFLNVRPDARDGRYVVGNWGIGMGVIWPTSVYNETSGDYRCHEINKKLDENHINRRNVTNQNLIDLGFPNWTAAKYKNECLSDPPPHPGSYLCDPGYEPGNCSSHNQIWYSDGDSKKFDDEYWNKCVFNDLGDYVKPVHKTSADNGGNLTYYESKLGNTDYCPVYCIEDFQSFLPYGDFTALAGNHFIWGKGSLSGSRTCRTKEIKWKKFENDIKNANDAVIDKFLAWKLEKEKDKKINEAVDTTPDVLDCGCVNETEHFKCCTEEGYKQATRYSNGNCSIENSSGDYVKNEYGNCVRTNKIKKYTDDTCSEEDSSGDYVKGEDDSCLPLTNTLYCKNGDDTKILPKAGFIAKVQISVDGVTKTDSFTQSAWCPASAPTADVTTKETEYTKAVSTLKSTITKMNNCTNWASDTIYNLKPNLKITYNDPIYNKISNTSLNIQDVSNIIYDKSKDGDSSCNYVNKDNYSCDSSTNTCTNKKVKILKCSETNKTREIKKYFQLPDNVYRYVNKESHISYYDIDEIPSSDFTKNYIDIGYSNFPVSYNKPNGIHNIEIKYSNLGHVLNGSTAIDVILNSVDSNFGEWICPYEVKSKLIPPPPDIKFGGIDLVYREIDLINPFPNIDANGRNTGSNWCAEGDCSNTNGIVNTYIHNNRGTQNYDVYKKEPMYTFILTPKVIREVRRYNHENEYGKYTGTMPNKKYDYKCNTGTGRTCVSDYFTHIIDITNAKSLPGTCVQDNVRVYNNPTTFENCRYN